MRSAGGFAAALSRVEKDHRFVSPFRFRSRVEKTVRPAFTWVPAFANHGSEGELASRATALARRAASACDVQIHDDVRRTLPWLAGLSEHARHLQRTPEDRQGDSGSSRVALPDRFWGARADHIHGVEVGGGTPRPRWASSRCVKSPGAGARRSNGSST